MIPSATKTPSAWRRLVWCALFFPLVLLAENPAYNCRFWTVKDGVPHNSVQALLQTSDGFLWVGTDGGLVSFDGLKFAHFTIPDLPRLEQASITALAETPDHTLWIGTLGLGLIQCSGSDVKWFNRTNGLPRSNVRSLLAARDGTLWVGTDVGAMCVREGKLEMVSGVDFGGAVTALGEDANQNIYLASIRGVSVVRQHPLHSSPEAVFFNDASTEGLRLVNARTLTFDRSGTLWVGANRSLAKFHPGTAQRGLSVTNLAHDIVSALHEDKRGNLWIGTYGGLSQIPVGANSPMEIKREGEAFDYIQAIHEDHEGNIWIGTKEGLARLQPKSFKTYSRQDGLRHNNVMSVMEDKKGQLWTGTWGGGLHYLQADRFIPHAQERDEGNTLVTAVAGDDKGQLWYGADNAVGLFCLWGNAQRTYNAANGFNTKGPRVIRQSRAGVFWIGTRDGVYSFDDQRFTQFATENGLNANSIWDIHEDRAGNIWAATDKGVDVYQDAHWRHVGLSTVVRCFYEDAEGTLWMGTKRGLARYQNGTLTTTDEAIFPTIVGILEDDQHWLWLASPTGIYALPKSDLAAALAQKHFPLKPILYDTSDGLLTESCNGYAQPSCWKSRDGRLWFATAKGLAAIEPKNARQTNLLPPPVVIEAVLADKVLVHSSEFRGQCQDPAGADTSTLNLKPGRGELEFRYTALSFSAAEKNRFRYKLEGADSDWVEAGARRTAYYYNLWPGEYVFHVIACNNDGVWNSIGENIKFSILPHYWQTWWFKSFIIIASLSTVGTSVRYATKKRMQLKLQRLEQQHTIEKERTRIAQDMHDDLGARLTEILLLSQRVEEIRTETDATVVSRTLSEATRDIAANINAIVWAVNPRNDSLDKMTSYLADYALKYLGRSSIKCVLDIPDDLPDAPVSSDQRHNLFLALKESLNNAVKHSNATQITLRMRLDQGQFHLQIEDNGKGFVAKETSETGNGMINMQKRMQNLGGHFELKSTPNQGASVHCRIPMKI